MLPNQITQEQWQAYRKVQTGERYNMITEWSLAARAAGLTQDAYLCIQENYRQLMVKYEPKAAGE